MLSIHRVNGWACYACQESIVMKIHDAFIILLVTLYSLMANTPLMAESTDSLSEDTLAKEVHAALIVADPGNVLYSRVGHCAIHMWAPEFELDYVFSYESEDARQKVLTFLAGNLKMGMFAVPFKDYLSTYAEEGRGVRQYELHLPLETKRNLWRVLDEHCTTGITLPYDYLARGCAHSSLLLLKEGLDTIDIEYGPWPERYDLSMRELTYLQLEHSPWSMSLLSIFTNGTIDSDCSKPDKLIMPEDLISVLSKAKIQGHPLMDSEAEILLPSIVIQERPWFTPLKLAIILLLIVSLTPILFRKKKVWIKYSVAIIMLGLQFIIGALTTYLVCFSKLCCTEWSWLIIPYNVLPLLCWKWRRYWLLPYAGVILIWVLFMEFSPHQLTEPSYIIFAIAIIVFYIMNYIEKRR